MSIQSNITMEQMKGHRNSLFQYFKQAEEPLSIASIWLAIDR